MTDPPIPAGLIDRLDRIASMVPHGVLVADEAGRLRMRIRSWREQLARVEGEARVLRDEWLRLSELIGSAEGRIEQLRGRQ